MPVTAKVTISASGSHTKVLGAGTASLPYSVAVSHNFTDGTGASQVDRVFTDSRTLGASATENLDLAGVLTDAYGAVMTFATIKSIVIEAVSGNTNDVQVTRPATNGVLLFLAAGDGIAIKPGGAFAWTVGAGAGITVTAATGDILTITNSGAGTSVTYKIVIVGTSA